MLQQMEICFERVGVGGTSCLDADLLPCPQSLFLTVGSARLRLLPWRRFRVAILLCPTWIFHVWFVACEGTFERGVTVPFAEASRSRTPPCCPPLSTTSSCSRSSPLPSPPPRTGADSRQLPEKRPQTGPQTTARRVAVRTRGVMLQGCRNRPQLGPTACQGRPLAGATNCKRGAR